MLYVAINLSVSLMFSCRLCVAYDVLALHGPLFSVDNTSPYSKVELLLHVSSVKYITSKRGGLFRYDVVLGCRDGACIKAVEAREQRHRLTRIRRAPPGLRTNLRNGSYKPSPWRRASASRETRFGGNGMVRSWLTSMGTVRPSSVSVRALRPVGGVGLYRSKGPRIGEL